jgi:hypothetical protein
MMRSLSLRRRPAIASRRASGAAVLRALPAVLFAVDAAPDALARVLAAADLARVAAGLAFAPVPRAVLRGLAVLLLRVPEDRLVPADRLVPEDLLDPEARPEPDEPLVPEARPEPVERLAPDARLEPEERPAPDERLEPERDEPEPPLPVAPPLPPDRGLLPAAPVEPELRLACGIEISLLGRDVQGGPYRAITKSVVLQRLIL